MNLRVADEIRKQLTESTLAMLGADCISEMGTSLTFNIKGSKKFTHITITLTAVDLYNITFMRIRKFDVVAEKLVKSIYCNQLHKIIEQETGLATKLR